MDVAANEGFELVVFDLDGVLIDSEMISVRLFVDWLRSSGVKVDVPFVFSNFVGRSYASISAEIATRFGKELPASFEAGYRAALLEAYECSLQPITGIAEVLEGLAIPFCVASSSGRERAERSLAIAGLSKWFDRRVFTAGDVVRSKPAPDLFLHAARNMGVAPARCLVVEDSPVGIVAAQAAGMTAWLFTGGSHYSAGLASTQSCPEGVRILATMGDFFQPIAHLRKLASC